MIYSYSKTVLGSSHVFNGPKLMKLILLCQWFVYLSSFFCKDSSPEDVMKEMDKFLTKQLNDLVGIKAQAFRPGSIQQAAMEKLTAFGIPVSKYI